MLDIALIVSLAAAVILAQLIAVTISLILIRLGFAKHLKRDAEAQNWGDTCWVTYYDPAGDVPEPVPVTLAQEADANLEAFRRDVDHRMNGID